MTLEEVRELIKSGYYQDTMESEEILGLGYQWFPHIDYDRGIEEIVADICFG
jgi:hypothetical protein